VMIYNLYGTISWLMIQSKSLNVISQMMAVTHSLFIYEEINYLRLSISTNLDNNSLAITTWLVMKSIQTKSLQPTDVFLEFKESMVLLRIISLKNTIDHSQLHRLKSLHHAQLLLDKFLLITVLVMKLIH